MRAVCLLLMAGGLGFAQLDSDTITILSQSSTSAPPPGTAVVSLTVSAAIGIGLDEVLDAVAETGVSERELTGVDGSGGCVPSGQACTPALTWRFQFNTPISALKETLAKLGLAGGPKRTISVSYSVYTGGTATEPECAYPTLISHARRHAENLAAAAGARVGRVVALSDAPEDANVTPTAVSRIGDFSAVLSITGSFLFGTSAWFNPAAVFPTTCTVAVQFQMLR